MSVQRTRAQAAIYRSTAFLYILLLAFPAWGRTYTSVPTPADLYGELFEQVQLQQVFPDGKTFVDSVPKRAPAEVLSDYLRARREPGFNLSAFVHENFVLPEIIGAEYHSDRKQSVCKHIDALWSVLTRISPGVVPNSSLLPLPNRYVVPGGRFREIYYWDSYFTMLGLETSGRHDLVLDMARNFAFLIDTYGHIPNGNRSYYLSRSQPPFFAAIVELIAARDGPRAYAEFLPQLEQEYAFWMRDAETVEKGSARSRVVRLKDGRLLNRYWDDRDTPREESYREDVETARVSGRPPREVYRNLRAAAESGWDFSSRWLADGRTLATIRTVDLIPVDLNSLMFNLETTLSRAYEAAGAKENAARFKQRADERAGAMRKYLWNSRIQAFSDYDWREGKPADRITAAMLYPLFFGVSTKDQAAQVAGTVRTHLVKPDGLITTTVNTSQQWDAPNGWAPLQWVAVKGLSDYGHADVAETIAQSWIRENIAVYRATGKLVEKYDVTGDASAKGGEYPLQDGFGWTNGVLRKLLTLYSRPAEDC